LVFFGYKKEFAKKRGFPSYFSSFFAIFWLFFFGVNFAKALSIHPHDPHKTWIILG